MFQVKNLAITHKKDLTTLVDGLTFTLAPGDRAALIGEEGNGKSTVLKLLYDPALVEPYAEWTGEIVDKGLRKGYLAQELRPEELALPVWEFCRCSPAFEEAAPKALDQAARQVGLSADLFWDDRPISTLSGGERVKLRLALLLLDSPDVLLLDEPSNDLDLQTLEWLENFLLSCQVPVLYISHGGGRWLGAPCPGRATGSMWGSARRALSARSSRPGRSGRSTTQRWRLTAGFTTAWSTSSSRSAVKNPARGGC